MFSWQQELQSVLRECEALGEQLLAAEANSNRLLREKEKEAENASHLRAQVTDLQRVIQADGSNQAQTRPPPSPDSNNYAVTDLEVPFHHMHKSRAERWQCLQDLLPPSLEGKSHAFCLILLYTKWRGKISNYVWSPNDHVQSFTL